MQVPLVLAMACTVVLLVTTTYFIMGSLPLLVLDHDTPMDARFVRGFFNIYYRAAFPAAGATACAYAFAGRYALATGAAGLVVVVALLRGKVLRRMDALGSQIPASSSAIQDFRRIHGVAIGIKVLQLVAIVWGLIAARL